LLLKVEIEASPKVISADKKSMWGADAEGS